MTAPTIQQVIDKYHGDRARIREIRSAAEAQVQAIEEFQSKREKYLLGLEDPECFDFLTDLYINGRDGKATAEAKKKDLGLQMAEIEKWLLKMLDKMKSTGFKTACGTVFPTRKESVTVEDWDAFLEAEILRPMVENLKDLMVLAAAGATPEELAHSLRASAHFELITKGVAKTGVLDIMGEQNPKDHSRPNPPPPGVKYTAIRTVGVRKS